MHSIIIRFAVLFLCVACVSSPVFSAEYMGFGVGSGNYSIRPLESVDPNGGFKVDKGRPLRLFMGGRRANTGFELDITRAEYDWEESGGLASHYVSSFSFSALGYKPLAQGSSVFAKLGLTRWKTKVDFLGISFEGDDGISPNLGGGLNIALDRGFHLRLELQYIPNVGDGLDKGNLFNFTLSGIMGL